MTTLPKLEPEISDEEIVAHTVRLARSGRFVTGRPLLEELYAEFDKEPQERVRWCARQAAELMIRQHGETPATFRRH